MDAVLGQARDLCWLESRIHFEYFASEVVQKADDGSFEVEVASTRKVVAVTADQTIASALLDAGVDVPLSCEQGVCGTCLTRVIAGRPDHRDKYLTPAEQKRSEQILVCCSRSLSPRLVLDL